jgi:glycine hydroxymethyltransferase
MLVDLRPLKITGKELEHRLDEVRITANKNAIPFDPESPFITSGIRLGTPAVTSRGFVEEDMKVIAKCISDTARGVNKEGVLNAVNDLCMKYPLKVVTR